MDGRQSSAAFSRAQRFWDGYGCAVAAVRGGAEWIQGTINGMGERAGNADIGEVAMALTGLYGVPVTLNLTKIREVSHWCDARPDMRLSRGNL